MTIEQILEIVEKYKLRMPPTAFYELKADIVNFEEPTTKNNLGVLDKIRAEIETKYGQCDICEYFEDYDYEENDISEYRPIGNIADILQIIDKYKEIEEDEKP